MAPGVPDPPALPPWRRHDGEWYGGAGGLSNEPALARIGFVPTRLAYATRLRRQFHPNWPARRIGLEFVGNARLAGMIERLGPIVVA
jgi:hypothetical protein